MKTNSADIEDTALDALLSQAPRYMPQPGFADRVLAALHEEEEAEFAAPVFASPVRRPWYTRPYGWGSAVAAAAACLVAAVCILPLAETQDVTANALALDDAVLVEEAFDCIEDDDLITAICCVSSGAYSISTGEGY